jgi:pimeloyl-ACP methyl ester carboxylesterase
VWGRSGELPLLAAHGWLDNAGSFDLLAPRLPACELVALDLAGHGRSDSRSPDSAYNLWQDVGDLLEVAEQLGWSRFNLLGHSRGAAISMLFAAAFPERVGKLVMLEGALPIVGEAADAPEELARALLDKRTLRDKAGRVFPQRASAITERAQGFSKVSEAAAEVLAGRSLREVAGGFQWHADKRLKGRSEMRLTADHVRAFVRRVSAPVLLLFAEESPFSRTPFYEQTIPLFQDIEVAHLPGGHHFHLDAAVEEIAARIRGFLSLSA